MDLIANFFTNFVTEFYAIRNLADLGIWLINVIIMVTFILFFLLKSGLLEVDFKKFFLAGCAFGGVASMAAALGFYDNIGVALSFFTCIWLLGVPLRVYKKNKVEN